MPTTITFHRFATLMNECTAVLIDGDLSFPVVDVDDGIGCPTVEITNSDDEGNLHERFFDDDDKYSIRADGSVKVVSKAYDTYFIIKLLGVVKATA